MNEIPKLNISMDGFPCIKCGYLKRCGYHFIYCGEKGCKYFYTSSPTHSEKTESILSYSTCGISTSRDTFDDSDYSIDNYLDDFNNLEDVNYLEELETIELETIELETQINKLTEENLLNEKQMFNDLSFILDKQRLLNSALFGIK